MYTDAPDPGAGFLSVNIITIIILLAIPIFYYNRLAVNTSLLTLVMIACIGGSIVFGFIIHAAFNTRYSIDESTLAIRNGHILKAELELEEIRDIGTVSFNRQTFGTAFNMRGYCNRFIGGVRILTDDLVIYLSPTDPVEWIEELERRRGKTAVGRG